MLKAIDGKVFPGAVLLAASKKKIVFHEAYGLKDIFTKEKMSKDTFFDLASLTKPLGTTLAIMKLCEAGLLDIRMEIGECITGFCSGEKGKVKIANLLAHNSGLPAYRPYYIDLAGLPPHAAKKQIRNYLVREEFKIPLGKETIYSDLGFMILEWIIEKVSGKSMDMYLYESVYGSLGIDSLFYIDISGKHDKKNYAATEYCLWRKKLVKGFVHDENAYACGGVQGHAGLFGTAREVYRILSHIMTVANSKDMSCVFNHNTVKKFLEPFENTGRTLGFDRPEKHGSSAGTMFSEDSVGHLGFTGTSFWMDLKREIIVILLTNRIHPTRRNTRIKFFRPKIHDAIMKAILF